MKYFKLTLTLVLSAAVFYALNTKFGSIPPLGKFLAPNQGFWQNDFTESGNQSDFELSGLQEAVSVRYDEQLIPHVFAQNNTDLYRAQGYITAQHRLWQMEFQTMAAAGRLSSFIGPGALNYDREQRRKGMIYGAEQALATMKKDPETFAYVEAYRDGVNAYLAELQPREYPVEYKLLDYAPKPWTTEKTALLLMYMTDMLAGGDDDLAYTLLLQKIGRERFDFLFPDFFDVNDPIIPADRDWSDWEVTVPKAPDDYQPLTFDVDPMTPPHPDNGSNNWAVSPEKSATGNAILANDPHLGLNLPSIWYVMQLATPEQNTMGATLPGALGIVIGFNNHISWGVTNATRDVKDWYKIEFQDHNRSAYRYEGEWRKTEKRLERIEIRGQKPFIDTVIYTHHGPVSYDSSFKGNGRRKEGYAMKWTGHLGGNNQRTLIELNAAEDYDAYKKALVHFAAPAQNFAFSSVTGDIAIWIQGDLPNKWKEQGKFLLDGSKASHDWQGFIPQEHNAHVKNPPRGFISSANQHPVDPSYPYYVFNDGYETYRNRVINDFFRSKEKVSLQDFKDLHNNNYNLKAAELIPSMLAAFDTLSLNSEEKAFANTLGSWDFNNDIDKIGPTYWEILWNELRNMVWDEMSNDSLLLTSPFTYQTIYLLKNHPTDAYMDIQETPEKETAADLFLLSLQHAAAEVEVLKAEGSDMKWGGYKGTFAGHLLQALPAFSRFNIPIGGNSSIVNATSKNHGPSWRMIVEMSNPPKALGIYPGGQSGNPGSRYYDNMIDTWAAGEYHSLAFMQENEADQTTIFSHTLTPRK